MSCKLLQISQWRFFRTAETAFTLVIWTNNCHYVGKYYHINIIFLDSLSENFEPCQLLKQTSDKDITRSRLYPLHIYKRICDCMTKCSFWIISNSLYHTYQAIRNETEEDEIDTNLKRTCGAIRLRIELKSEMPKLLAGT